MKMVKIPFITALRKAETAIETQKSKGRVRIDPDYFMDWQ